MSEAGFEPACPPCSDLWTGHCFTCVFSIPPLAHKYLTSASHVPSWKYQCRLLCSFRSDPSSRRICKPRTPGCDLWGAWTLRFHARSQHRGRPSTSPCLRVSVGWLSWLMVVVDKPNDVLGQNLLLQGSVNRPAVLLAAIGAFNPISIDDPSGRTTAFALSDFFHRNFRAYGTVQGSGFIPAGASNVRIGLHCEFWSASGWTTISSLLAGFDKSAIVA